MLFALLPPALPAQESTAPVMSYQGFLTTPAGAPLNGSHEIQFRLYDTLSEGAVLWQETHPSVAVRDGRFDVLLGEIAPFLDDPEVRDFNRRFYLAVRIDGGEELTPRLALASLPIVGESRPSQRIVTVDCEAGESIADALDAAAVGQRLTINLTENCTENVVIERDGVTLNGGGTTLTGDSQNTPAVGNAVVYLDGVRDIEIADLTVRGAADDTADMHGIVVADVSSATVSNGTVVESHDGHGIRVTTRSNLVLTDVFVRENGIDGLNADQGSNLDVTATDIRDNLGSGIKLSGLAAATFTSTMSTGNGDGVDEFGNCDCALFMLNGASARVEQGNTFRSSELSGDTGGAVVVSRGSILRFATGPSVVENTTFLPSMRDDSQGLALGVYHGSVVRVSTDTAVTIGGIVASANTSTVDLRNVSVTGNVVVAGQSANVRLRDESGIADRVSLTGDVVLSGGTFGIDVPPDSRAARVDGNVDCQGIFRNFDLILFEDAEDGWIDCPGVQTNVTTSIAETANTVSVDGRVTYRVTVENVQRSPAVEARTITVDLSVSSSGPLGVETASTAASPAAGSCDVIDSGSFAAPDFVGMVRCTFDAVRLTDALVDLTVSITADLNLDVAASVSNGDHDESDNSASTVTAGP